MRTKLILAFSVILLAVSGCSYKAPTVTGTDQVYDPNIEATALKDNEFESISWPAVDNIMLGLVDNPGSESGCAVGVVRDHEIIYLQGYGFARLPGSLHILDPGEKWGVATMGAVGSISKTFTAAAAMQMHDLGLIDVNNQVKDYLNTTNGPLGNARIYDLLNHASGVGGDTQGEAFEPNWEPGTFVTDCIDNDPDTQSPWCQALIQILARPSSAFHYYEDEEDVENLGMADLLNNGIYSNVGYSVLGAIIDEVAQNQMSSDGYEAFVWDYIGTWSDNLLEGGNMLSLALTHSWRKGDISHRAVGYENDGPAVFEAWEGTGSIEGWEGPSGGWTMTIGDLSRFMIALDNGDFFINNAMLAAMRYEWTDLTNFSDHYGFGMFLGNGSPNSPDYWHGGVIGPHNAVWTWWENYAGQEIGVAMMCNRGDTGVWTQKARAADIAQIAAYGDPNPVGEIQFQPLDSSGISGADAQIFELDPSQGWQAEPNGAFVPMTGLSHRLLLTPKVSRTQVSSFELAEGRITQDGVEFSGRPVTTLQTRVFSNPRFLTHGATVVLETAVGEVVISDLEVEGFFTDRGETLSSVALSGTIDTRQFVDLGGPSFETICRDVEDAGASCQPCADGKPACVDVRYEGLRGNAAGRAASNNPR